MCTCQLTLEKPSLRKFELCTFMERHMYIEKSLDPKETKLAEITSIHESRDVHPSYSVCPNGRRCRFRSLGVADFRLA